MKMPVMKSSALILLLLMMLAPRLGAAPHALACAPALAQAGSVALAATGEPAAHHHGNSALAHVHHASGEQGSLAAASEPQQAHHSNHNNNHNDNNSHHGMHDGTAETSADTISDASTGDNCKHCNQCEQHCSAVIPVELPRQLIGASHEPVLAQTPSLLAGFASSLNRPPRTSSI